MQTDPIGCPVFNTLNQSSHAFTLGGEGETLELVAKVFVLFVLIDVTTLLHELEESNFSLGTFVLALVGGVDFRTGVAAHGLLADIKNSRVLDSIG